MLRTRPLWTSACLLVLCFAIASEARASVHGSFEYVKAYGDTYDGVTTDDGDHLGSSFALRATITSGRFGVLYMFHRYETASLTNGTTASGAPGTTINYPGEQIVVPLFTAHNAESEFRLEYQPWRGPIYVGAAYSNTFNNYAFPRLLAFGIGAEIHPNPAKRISPYGSFFYFPRQTGTFPMAAPSNPQSGPVHQDFWAYEELAGGSWTIAKTGLSVRFGYYQNDSERRTGTYNIVSDGPFVGLGYSL
jgi:hypothetical protein